jgi:pantoate--beta-alanine ligase
MLFAITETRAWREEQRAAGKTVGLVPTMGAFHEGHLSLMRRAADECGAVIVSLFVNPAQFGPTEDYERYPRDLDRDVALAAEAGVDAIFNPHVEEIYPPGFQTTVTPGELAKGLCGAFRPVFFRGVATVVCKLFSIVQPDRAYFGQKDYQQLRVVQQMVSDLNLPLAIVACEIVREPDGLAMSSRNAYLSPEQRDAALSLSRAIRAAQEMVAGGERSGRRIERAVKRSIGSHPLVKKVEYAHVVDPYWLQRVATLEGPARLAIAAWVGDTRLIDNGELIP